MPSTKTEGIRLLIEKGPIHSVLWCNLIEARRNLIKPYLNTFTLLELGNLQCLEGESASLPRSIYHTLTADKSLLVNADKGLSLKTQGIFLEGLTEDIKFPDNVRRIVGLARSGEWIVAEIEIAKKGKIRIYEEAQKVRIHRQDLETILFGGLGVGIPPKNMWDEFGEAIKEWLRSRQRIYEMSLEIKRIIEIEDLLLLTRPIS